MEIKLKKSYYTGIADLLKGHGVTFQAFSKSVLEKYLENRAYYPRDFEGKLQFKGNAEPTPEATKSLTVQLTESAMNTLQELFESVENEENIEIFAGRVLIKAIKDAGKDPDREQELAEAGISTNAATDDPPLPPRVLGQRAFKENDEQAFREHQRDKSLNN